MSRRHLSYAVLVIASFVVAACSQPLAPRGDDTTGTCKSGVVMGSGNKCTPE